MSSPELVHTTEHTASRIAITGHHLLILLLIGGLLNLSQIADASMFLGSFSIDAIRNFLLLGMAASSVVVLVIQRNGFIPNILHIWPYLLFVGWAGLTAFWSIDLTYTLRDGLKLLYPILVYILACAFIRSSMDSQRLFKNIRLALTVFVVLTLLAATVGIALALWQVNWVWGTNRLLDIPLTVHPVVASLYVLIETAGWKKIPGWRPRWPLLVLTVIYVFLSLTRAYVLGLALAITALFWLSWRRWSGRMAAVVVGTIIVLLFLSVDNPVKRRMFWYPDQVTFTSLVQTVWTNPGRFVSEDYIIFSGRFVYWNYLLSTAHSLRPPIIGTGLGSNRPMMLESRFSDAIAHGDYAKYLAELGYIGFGLLILIYGVLLFWSAQAAQKQHLSPIGQAAALALFSQMVVAIIVSLVYDVFWLAYDLQTIAALLVAIIYFESVALNKVKLER